MPFIEGFLVWLLVLLLTSLFPRTSHSQSVQPAIVEYSSKADGRFGVTNNTAMPMTVILEPKSFSIAPDGHGDFRPLDSEIVVELSTMSVQLQPLQTYWVFYKANAERYPAWFTIYSTFIPARKTASLNVRFQLPHTVYLYQKSLITENDIRSVTATYSPDRHVLECVVKNVSKSLGRVQDVQISAAHGGPVLMAGFPLLPGAERHLEFRWESDEPPVAMRIRFPHFTLKPTIIKELSSATHPSRESGAGREDTTAER